MILEKKKCKYVCMYPHTCIPQFSPLRDLGAVTLPKARTTHNTHVLSSKFSSLGLLKLPPFQVVFLKQLLTSWYQNLSLFGLPQQKYHRLGDLNNKFTFTVLEGRQIKRSKCWPIWFLGRACTGLQTATFFLCPHMTDSKFSGVSYKGTKPIMRIPPL